MEYGYLNAIRVRPRMWVEPDVLGLFSVGVGSFSDNVGFWVELHSRLMWARNCDVIAPGSLCYRATTPIQVRRGKLSALYDTGAVCSMKFLRNLLKSCENRLHGRDRRTWGLSTI
jgi:hypothetical protein